jgi:hypothetical protein
VGFHSSLFGTLFSTGTLFRAIFFFCFMQPGYSYPYSKVAYHLKWTAVSFSGFYLPGVKKDTKSEQKGREKGVKMGYCEQP